MYYNAYSFYDIGMKIMEQELSLMAVTRRLLKERGDITIMKIYDDLRIPPGWTQKFMAGKFPNPSVNRVQQLYEYLSGKTLIV